MLCYTNVVGYAKCAVSSIAFIIKYFFLYKVDLKLNKKFKNVNSKQCIVAITNLKKYIIFFWKLNTNSKMPLSKQANVEQLHTERNLFPFNNLKY